jgi:hypothetical protein
VIPPSVKNPAREGKLSKIPDVPTTINFKKKVEFQPFNTPEEWPGDEVAQNFNFSVDGGLAFTDPQSFELPPSFNLSSSQITFWRRPTEFIRDEVSQEEEKPVRNDSDGHLPGRKSMQTLRRGTSQEGKMLNRLGDEFLETQDDIEIRSPTKVKKKKKAEKLVLQVI